MWKWLPHNDSSPTVIQSSFPKILICGQQGKRSAGKWNMGANIVPSASHWLFPWEQSLHGTLSGQYPENFSKFPKFGTNSGLFLQRQNFSLGSCKLSRRGNPRNKSSDTGDSSSSTLARGVLNASGGMRPPPSLCKDSCVPLRKALLFSPRH